MTVEEIKKLIVDNLRQARIKAGLSQPKLAKKVGCAISLIGQYESGRQFMSFDTFLYICQALEIEPSEMMRGDI